jgi:Na+/citrate or Na+/malate symporter
MLVMALGLVFAAVGLYLAIVDHSVGGMVFLVLGVATVVIGQWLLPERFA